eukprot:SAG31_NODE_23102_length_511_cov_0.939320_1_plen_29_part_01
MVKPWRQKIVGSKVRDAVAPWLGKESGLP